MRISLEGRVGYLDGVGDVGIVVFYVRWVSAKALVGLCRPEMRLARLSKHCCSFPSFTRLRASIAYADIFDGMLFWEMPMPVGCFGEMTQKLVVEYE